MIKCTSNSCFARDETLEWMSCCENHQEPMNFFNNGAICLSNVFTNIDNIFDVFSLTLLFMSFTKCLYIDIQYSNTSNNFSLSNDFNASSNAYHHYINISLYTVSIIYNEKIKLLMLWFLL